MKEAVPIAPVEDKCSYLASFAPPFLATTKVGRVQAGDSVMPLWAEHEPDCRFVVIAQAKHAANLDQPEIFHKTLMDFLLDQRR